MACAASSLIGLSPSTGEAVLFLRLDNLKQLMCRFCDVE
jgi:hypothetical protein